MITIILNTTPGNLSKSADQYKYSFLWNPSVDYNIHESPPLNSILSHFNSVHSLTSYLFLFLGSPTKILYVFLIFPFVLQTRLCSLLFLTPVIFC